MSKKIVCYGEVLWDILPTESVAGGAPMNVAIRSQSLGIQSSIISRVGIDEPGNRLIQFLEDKNVDVSLIQQDTLLPTGEVLVTLDDKGSATYDIVYPSAWDNIELTTNTIEAVKKADAFVFGSLVCRNEVSKQTLLSLLKEARYKVFDVNLRKPYYLFPLLEQLMFAADMIKLNDDELFEISQALGCKESSIESCIRFIAAHTQTVNICVTLGSKGAILYTNNVMYKHEGYSITVADTIGAGDSFLAALLSKKLQSAFPEDSLAFACAIGAIVAGKKGANPSISFEEINSMIKNIDR